MTRPGGKWNKVKSIGYRRSRGTAAGSAAEAPRGFVLVIVLIVIALLALATYAFSELMFSYKESTDLGGRQLQARCLVDSGVEYLRTLLTQSRQTRIDNGGVYDNADLLRHVIVIDDTDVRMRGSFTVIAPNMDSSGYLNGTRMGIEDESARLNLNSLMIADKIPNAARQLLMALPGMTEDVADAILDWLDEDDEQREYGAEAGYYAGLEPAYAPRNAPFQTVEELLLIRGVTPEALFGRDVNRNGVVDQHEIDMPLPDGFDNSDGALDRGWSAFLTLFSMEKNVTSLGLPRINLNQDDLEKLHTDLMTVFTEEWANFIVLYRQNGTATGATGGTAGGSGGSGSPAGTSGNRSNSGSGGGSGSGTSSSAASGSGNPSGGGANSQSGNNNQGGTSLPTQTAAGVTMDFTRPSKTKFNQILDLIGASVQVTLPGTTSPAVVTSPFVEEPLAIGVYMPALMDNCCCSDAPFIPGRVNINQAPRQILMGIPGIKEEVVNEILSRRDTEPDGQNPNRKYETWLLTELIVTKEEMRQLLPFVCAAGDVYRAQVIGYFQDGSAASRAEVIFDATQSIPRILRWRDMSHLGRGYALETLGVDLEDY
ncbi:MAG: general secretion pathway protein GspK [Planctomycetes bacterium]|nr:general secretion pathway protein GspK [Planctomycetota bacterium]